MRPDPTRQRVAIFGHFGAGNLGNEATLRAMVLNLRRHLPGVEISCVCSGPTETAAEYNIAAAPIRAPLPMWRRFGASSIEGRSATCPDEIVSGDAQTRRSAKLSTRLKSHLRIYFHPLAEIYRWSKALAALNGSSALVMTGTGMLGDASLHYEIFRWAVVAKLCRCKLLFVSVGAGAVRQPLRRWFVKTALKLADYRSYRDISSKDYLKTIGLDVENDPVYPDLAFGLPRAVIPSEGEAGRPGAAIGVGLVHYFGFGRSENDQAAYRHYVGCVADFVAAMLERNYAVRILIGDFVWDQGVRHDLRIALKERGVTYQHGKIIDEPAISVDELLLQLSSLDVVVSSRFHNLVLALMLNKPVFAISYHDLKFHPLMQGVGLSDFYYDIDDIDVDELIAKVVRLQENAPAAAGQIARQTERYRAALDRQYEQIIEVIGQCAGSPRPII